MAHFVRLFEGVCVLGLPRPLSPGNRSEIENLGNGEEKKKKLSYSGQSSIPDNQELPPHQEEAPEEKKTPNDIRGHLKISELTRFLLLKELVTDES